MGFTSDRAQPALPVYYSYEVLDSWPHDALAFTQGLVFYNGILFESTGLRGRSSLRIVDLETGNVTRQVDLHAGYFAEGLTALDDKLYQLSWLSHTGFVYDVDSLKLQANFTYRGEGWGLTNDGYSLIMSDGTDRLRFLDPVTFKTEKIVPVYDPAKPMLRLNELEYVNGEIFANIYPSSQVARIDPSSGKVLGYIDFTDLLPPADSAGADVLNGIAYDAISERLFVTGKLWPTLFEVRLKLR